MEKPDVDSIEGLSPAISIEQKTTIRSPRSTVGTITEVYDYLRLLFSSIGMPSCPRCDRPITRQSVDQIVSQILADTPGKRGMILAPSGPGSEGANSRSCSSGTAGRDTCGRGWTDSWSTWRNLRHLDKRKNHTVEIVVDRLQVLEEARGRIRNSVQHAVEMADGLVAFAPFGGSDLLYSRNGPPVSSCGISMPELEPRSFSFNSRFGACSECEGLGIQLRVNLRRLIPDRDATVDTLSLELPDRDLKRFLQAISASPPGALLPGSRSPSPAGIPTASGRPCAAGLEKPILFRYGELTYTARFPGLEPLVPEEAPGHRKR